MELTTFKGFHKYIYFMTKFRPVFKNHGFIMSCFRLYGGVLIMKGEKIHVC